MASDPPRVEVLEYKHLKPDHVDGAEINNHQIDVLLLTVTDTEFLAAYKILPSPKEVDAGELGPIYFGKIGLNDVALLKTSSEAVSATGPTATSLVAIERFNPRVILSIGVCFGMDRENLELGDVLVSAKMGLYGPAKINKNGQIYSRGPLFECNARLQRLFDFGKVGWKGPTEGKTPNVHVGLVISGPQTIENYDRKEQLRNLYPEALGGEQVGEG